MKFSDINNRYTQIVGEYLANGYTFNASTMGGSQGEVCHVDLTNGSEIIRIYINEFSNWTENLEGVEIVVGRSTDDVKPNGCNSMETVWTSRLEVLSREQFYQLSRRGRDIYGTKDEAKAAIALRIKRYGYRDTSRKQNMESPEMIKIAKRIIRKKFGIKRVSADEVKLVKDSRGYIVYYRCKSYRLH